MSLGNMSDHKDVHVALLPNAGMGHLTPFLRLASLLVNHHCQVTLIAPQPTVSKAESNLLSRFQSDFPQVNVLPFHVIPLDPSSANSDDPFFLQFGAIRQSCHLLPSLLSSVSPPLSAFVCDMTLITPVLPITQSLGVPVFILFTSSAMMLSLFSCIHRFIPEIYGLDSLEIPGVSIIPRSSIPPLLLLPNNIFANILLEDGPKLTNSCGILVNSFESLESKTLESLNAGKVVKELPHVFPIGPLVPCEFEKNEREELNNSSPLMKWLNDQTFGSVVYLSFGSRLSMAREQVREIGEGLMKSRYKFLWVVKDKKVDKEEEEGLEEVIGIDLMEKLKSKGMVLKEWVEQSEILSHASVGGFVSHCGWNSVVEAAWNGVPILGWPQIGDQKLNAEVVEKSGWGIWKKTWGWSGEKLVRGEEIGEAIDEIMNNKDLKVKAGEIREAASDAVSGCGGSSMIGVQKLIGKWKKMAEMKH